MELARELPDSLELSGIVYENPHKLIESVADVLEGFASIKNERDTKLLPKIRGCDGQELNLLDAAIALTKQKILEHELEIINSFLCGPRRCTLCCTGPTQSSRQEFFEIPVLKEELALFDLPLIDLHESRMTTANAEPELKIDGVSFYKKYPAAVYNWATGFSLILARGSRCPHLKDSGTCNIYSMRLKICRKPQIFPVVIEERNEGQKELVKRDVILAIWDCPYVRDLKTEIMTYAIFCGLDCIFKENKA